MTIEETPSEPILTPAIIDPSFGTLGVVTLAVPNASTTILRGMTQTPNGYLYVTGSATIANQSHFWIACLNADGALDSSFGQRGVITGQFSVDDDFPIESFGEHIVFVTHAGTEYMLLCGRAYDSEGGPNALARFTTKGELDTTFGIAGKLIVHIDLGIAPAEHQTPEAHRRPRYDADTTSTYSLIEDKLLITRVYSLKPSHKVSLIIRLDLQGALDKTFNKTGFVIVRHHNFANDITAVQSILVFNEKYIAAGYLTREREQSHAFVACYHRDGILDETFNNSGYRIISHLGPAFINPNFSKAIQQINNRILAIGGTSFSTYQGLLASLDADGSFNIQFNSATPLTTALGQSETSWITGTQQTRDNTLVVAGTWHHPENTDFDLDWCIARYLDDGKPDLSFNKTGWGFVRLSNGEDYPVSIVDAPNSKLIVAGNSGPAAGRVASIVRIFGYS